MLPQEAPGIDSTAGMPNGHVEVLRVGAFSASPTQLSQVLVPDEEVGLKTNQVNPQLDYTIISQSQAQQEHEWLSRTVKVGRDHRSRSWKDCAACKRRFTRMKVKVIK